METAFTAASTSAAWTGDRHGDAVSTDGAPQ